MGLKISKNVGLTEVLTQNIYFDEVNKVWKDKTTNQVVNNPTLLSTQHINTGEAKATRLFLFNVMDTVEGVQKQHRYENIVLSPKDTVGTNESSWVQLAPDNNGTAGAYSNTLTMANINDLNVAKPFWVRVTNPSGNVAFNKNDLSIDIAANEFAV